MMLDVVAEYPTIGCVHASYEVRAEVRNPASLLNQDSLIDDDAIVFTCPADPVYAKPCVSDGKKKLPTCVDDAVEKYPPSRPSVVDVELYPDTDVNGNVCPARVDVDTVPTSPFDPVYAYPCDRSDSFVPFSVVDELEKRPAVNPITVEVELYPVLTVNGNENDEMVSGLVPEHVVPPEHDAEMTPELVRAPLLFESPVPSRLLNDEPLTIRFVVDAVLNDE